MYSKLTLKLDKKKIDFKKIDNIKNYGYVRKSINTFPINPHDLALNKLIKYFL